MEPKVLSRNIKLGPKVLNNDVNQPPSPNTATKHTPSLQLRILMMGYRSNCVGEEDDIKHVGGIKILEL